MSTTTIVNGSQLVIGNTFDVLPARVAVAGMDLVNFALTGVNTTTGGAANTVPGPNALVTVNFAFSDSIYDPEAVDVKAVLAPKRYVFRLRNLVGATKSVVSPDYESLGEQMYVWYTVENLLNPVLLTLATTARASSSSAGGGSSTATVSHIAAPGVAIAANPSRVSFTLQNVGTTTVFVNFSGVTPTSAADCSYVLAAESEAGSGYGASYTSTKYQGAVSVGPAGLQVIATEF